LSAEASGEQQSGRHGAKEVGTSMCCHRTKLQRRRVLGATHTAFAGTKILWM
jgi:hypothetical protein